MWTVGQPVTQWTNLQGRTALKSVCACEKEDWSLLLWDNRAIDRDDVGDYTVRPETTSVPVRVPFRCGSWRCRRCAQYRGAIDWTRIKQAVEKQSRKWLYLVLTTDPSNYPTRWDAMRAMKDNWAALRKRLERAARCAFTYLQTWEVFTKTGWPHVNVIIQGEHIDPFIERLGGTARKRDERGRWHVTVPGFRSWLRRNAAACGFGRVVWAEMWKSNSDAMAGYFVKLANELSGAASKKGNQSPINAPPHFRRIRASRGFLPSFRRPPGEWTGLLWPGPMPGRDIKAPTAPPRRTREPREGRPQVEIAWRDVVKMCQQMESFLLRRERRMTLFPDEYPSRN